MSNRRTHAVALLLAASLSGCAQKPAALTESDRASIRTTIEEFTTAIGKNDFATAASFYAEDGVIMPPNGPAAQGRPGVQRSFEGFGRTQSFSQSVVEIEGEGNLAYARIDYEVTFTPPNATASVSDKGKALIVMRKETDGRWRTIRGMHSSDLPASR
jgi:uncharacterized protein (TIGR02246 family)